MTNIKERTKVKKDNVKALDISKKTMLKKLKVFCIITHLIELIKTDFENVQDFKGSITVDSLYTNYLMTAREDGSPIKSKTIYEETFNNVVPHKRIKKSNYKFLVFPGIDELKKIVNKHLVTDFYK